LKTFALAALTRHHAAEPLSPGLEMEDLRTRLPYQIGARNYRALADRLARETDLVREESTLRLKTHRVKLGESDGRLVARIEAELHKAGFDVANLTVQWHVKLAFPLIAPVSMLLAIPFALLVGTRGAVGGVALGVAIGIVYWTAARLLEAMGGVGQLPPFLAAWSTDITFLFLGLYFFFKMPT